MVVKEKSKVSPSAYYSHLDCFCMGNGIQRGDVEAIKQVKQNGNFRVSLVSAPPNDANCANCQLPIRV